MDDLTDASVLVQITDASGKSDDNGVISEDGGNDPLADCGWIRRELVMWMDGNVGAKFDSVRRLGRDR